MRRNIIWKKIVKKKKERETLIDFGVFGTHIDSSGEKKSKSISL